MKRVGCLSLSKAPWSDGALGGVTEGVIEQQSDGALGGLPEPVEGTVGRWNDG